ncbi:hypothetical protein BS50DRAFT_30483 [Corynespora cassiicola Philippines]|uniref:PHD-type domain-containing protein n=1 Tax=Corynespora cassiicola Philippines TaxID=1448308 RepID=A0A2T2PBJ5_CORCC|nr:hypothetical protein BS50DRAFT_30483 [Corynespora cassiicola Philippines]
MSLDQHIYGSTDWHLPSPSSTPKSFTFPDSTFRTPKTEAVPQSHFIDAWSTPRLVNGQQTPAQTPSFVLTTPVDRPTSSYSLKVRTPEDPDFHVNHFASSNLPLPPVEPSRRLSSSPDPLSVKKVGAPLLQNSLAKMDPSQMQTPPPTRDATSRRSLQQSSGPEFATPVTVIARTPGQVPPSETLFSQTPFGFPSLQFSPDMVQFHSTGPMPVPPLPQSRLFWDQHNDATQMDMDMSLATDPFGPTPHKVEGNLNWQAFQAPNQMNPQAFQALHGMSSPGPMTAYASANAAEGSRPSSFISTSNGVDPSMLFSFSSPGPATSFNNSMQQMAKNGGNRQPYETQANQFQESMREREMAKIAKSQHSRNSTASSTASFDQARPGLQRSNTDSGFRKSRPSSLESRSSGSTTGFNIPRRSSPLKRQSGGSLMSIPEVRRPRTRLIVDETGRARTETVPADEDADLQPPPMHKTSEKDLRLQYPGLYGEDDSESEPDEPITLSRNASFTMPQPQRRSSKHARSDSSGLDRSNSFKIPRPSSRTSSGAFDTASFDTMRTVKKPADNPFRRFSMMDFPTTFEGDEQMPDSPGDALGALKKVMEGRQKKTAPSSHTSLRAHNQRWAQATADLANVTAMSHGMYDPFSNSFNASPNATDAGLTTPSTDRSSMSGDSTRCVCNSAADDGRLMVQCESCNKWLHMACVGLNNQNLPPVYVCIFCTGQTPVARGGRVRGPPVPFDSPLTHKSVFRR